MKVGYNQQNCGLFCIIAAVILILTGCASQPREALRVCPGKQSAIDSLSLLRARSQTAAPIKATGRCLFEYTEDKKPKKENFPVKLWVNPPAQIRMQGDVALDPKAIVLGSNEHEFWLSMKPKEIDSYWWGRWSDQSGLTKLMISPRTVLEAFGTQVTGADRGGTTGWSLSNEGAFDVLVERNDQGAIVKKIHIYSCDYRVRKIEYFQTDGKPVAVTELDKYKEVSDGFYVPALVKMVSRGKKSVQDSVSFTIELKSIRPMSFSKKKQEQFFSPPEPRGFEHKFIIIDGDPVELR